MNIKLTNISKSLLHKTIFQIEGWKVVCHELFKKYHADMSELSLVSTQINHCNINQLDDNYNHDSPSFEVSQFIISTHADGQGRK